jgi:hypothetical protein
MLYGPIYLYWFWLSIRARSFFFFSAANPTIRNGGFLLESKKEIYDLIPAKYYPRTLFFHPHTSEDDLLKAIVTEKLLFPLIAKPDIGMRGLAVKKLENTEALLEYARESRVDFLVQEFIPYEKEIGIFYYRYPDSQKGKISGIVGKEFLAVTGDGVSSLEELLLRDNRFILQLKKLRAEFGETLQQVLPAGEEYLVVPYGNHSRGAKFLDLSNLVDAELTDMVDRISKEIPGFYYGRMDIRYDNWEDLKQRKHFSIIELNGAGSEPTHMYDPGHSVFFAWKEIIRHWNILAKISILNHRMAKAPYMLKGEGLAMFRQNAAYVKLITPGKK